MRVTFDIPDDIAAALTAGGRDLSRIALEALALEGYRTGKLTESHVRRMLGFRVRIQVHQFLKDHDVPLNYSYEDFLQDMEAAKRNTKPAAARPETDLPHRLAG